jgi:hypothetical protein
MQQAQGQGQECIGISDGSFRLDGPQSQTFHFGDDPNMASAAQAYRAGDGKAWSNAQGRTQQDAEPLIYIPTGCATRLNSEVNWLESIFHSSPVFIRQRYF